MKKYLSLSVLAMLLSVMNLAYADMSKPLMITNAWARASAPGAPSAGFMTVMNHSDKDDILLAVRGDFAKKMELHRTQKVDGVMKMIEQKNGIVIPAHGTVVFKPGDYHLMFMGLKKNFEVGETYRVTLVFKNAGEMTIDLPVKAASTMDKDASAHTHEHKH